MKRDADGSPHGAARENLSQDQPDRRTLTSSSLWYLVFGIWVDLIQLGTGVEVGHTWRREYVVHGFTNEKL